MNYQVRDINVNVEICGQGRPIVLLHGFWIDHHSIMGAFEPIFAGRTGWQRIYFDLPGMGATPASDWIVGSDQMLEVVDEIVQQTVGDEQSFALAGFSYGGYLARGLLQRRLTQINGLCLLAPVVDHRQADPHLPQHVTLVEDPAVMALVPPPLRPQMEATMVVQETRSFARLESELAGAFAAADRPFLERLRETGYHFSFDVDQLERPFEAPALIVAGRQDSGVGYWRAAQLANHYPRATFATLDRAGHGLNLEQEGLFNHLVDDWLARVEEAAGRPYDPAAERVIRAEVIVPASADDVWQAWSTAEGVRSFFAPDCRVELEIGGAYEMYFDPSAPYGERGGEGVRILAIEPRKMLSFTWNAPPHLPEVRPQHTAVVVRLLALADGRTRVTLIHSGWGSSEQWDQAYRYFAVAWQKVVLPRLKERFERGPIDWDNL